MIQLLTITFLSLLTSPLFAKTDFNLTYTVDKKNYQGYYIPAAKNAPFILLIHDWDGVTEYEVKRAHMLSKLGYSVFAADLYGAGIRPQATEEKRKLTGALYKNRTKMRRLLRAALDVAQKNGANVKNAVAIGYCFGGSVVLELARSGTALKGFVTFHGGLTTPKGQSFANTHGELLVFHGTADSAVSIEQFAALAKELESAGISHEMITYSGAEHAFSVLGGRRYNKSADQKSWRRFVEFLARTTQK